MHLPLTNIADYSVSLEPQWNSFQHILASFWHNPSTITTAIKATHYNYVHSDPLLSGLFIALVIAVIVYVVSEITQNSSQIDKLWSLLPVFYTLHFAIHPYLNNKEVPTRLVLMSILISIWGCRLTFNYARKGGYAWSAEDYRWNYIKDMAPTIFFKILNITFISVIQSYLLFAMAWPAYLALLVDNRVPLNFLDFLATGIFLLCLVTETIADQQQWNYQQAKHKAIKTNKSLTAKFKKGFITDGLFAYSRHPNFLAEQTLWFAVYLFSVAATGVLFNWSLIGFFVLWLVFQGSTPLTEWISAGKYPEYKNYQKAVGRMIPNFSGKYKPN